MNALAKTTISSGYGELKARLKSTWMTGDYDVFSRFMKQDAEHFFWRLGIKPGMRLLDVGCGSGQLAVIAARAGVQVTACDIATNWLERGRMRASAEGLKINFEEGDAENLPYDDGEFDAVVSLIGAMFAPSPELVATELTRVCRKGGTIAMANWTPEGFIGRMFKTIAAYIAPSGMPSPLLWGVEDVVRSRFRGEITDVNFSRHMYHFNYPFPPGDVVKFFRTYYGPMTRAFASLDEHGQDKLLSELTALWRLNNKALGNLTTQVDGEYLEVIATRSSN